MTLDPAFNSAVEEYTATTTNEKDSVTATPTDHGVDIEILVGSTEIENGADATWTEGENTVTITVSDSGESTVYTVTVTQST